MPAATGAIMNRFCRLSMRRKSSESRVDADEEEGCRHSSMRQNVAALGRTDAAVAELERCFPQPTRSCAEVHVERAGVEDCNRKPTQNSSEIHVERAAVKDCTRKPIRSCEEIHVERAAVEDCTRKPIRNSAGIRMLADVQDCRHTRTWSPVEARLPAGEWGCRRR